MNAFLEQRIANLMGPEPSYEAPMMMAEGGEVFDLDDPEAQAEASMAMESPVTDPNADLREAIDQLMVAQETAEDPLEAAKAQQLMEAAAIGSEAPMGEMAMELAGAGRGGDSMLAHLTPGEVILPLGMMDDPEFERVVENRFNQLDLNPEEYVAGLGIASLNPITGLEEFGFFKKLAKSVKKVVKKVVRPIAKVAQFIPGPWQPAAALISRAGTVYDVARGRASPLALAGAFAPLPGGAGAAAGAAGQRGLGSLLGGAREFITKGADGVGLMGNIGRGLGSLGRNVGNIFVGGGADGVGRFGRIGDFFGGIGDAVGVTDYGSQVGGPLFGGGSSDPVDVIQDYVEKTGDYDVVNRLLKDGMTEAEVAKMIQGQAGSAAASSGIGGLFTGGGRDGVGSFGRVGDVLGGIGDALGVTNYGSMAGQQMTDEEAQTTIMDYLNRTGDYDTVNQMIASGMTEAQIAAQIMGGGTLQRGGSFFGMRTPDSIRGIEDSIKGMLGMGGGSGGGGGGFNMGQLGAAGLAGLIGKLAYDEAKNRKGVPLTPSVVMNAAGRFNLENEIARRSGTAAPNPTEFGLLPQGTLPVLSGGRAPTEAQAELEKQKTEGMRYGGPVMAFAEGGNVDEQDFKRMNGDINGPGTEISDDIPAMLSDGEFVMTGRAVRGAGAFNMKNKNGIITLTPDNGEDRDRGTKLMYEMMDLFKEFADEPEAVA